MPSFFSLASSLQGIGRATIDGDLVAELMLRHCRPLADRLARRFLAPIEAIIPALQNESSFNAIHREYFVKVDVFVAKSRPWYRSQMARRQLMPFGDETRPPVWVSAPEDTILAKLDWYRLGGGVSDRQWGDVTGVMKVQAENLDLARLTRWFGEFLGTRVSSATAEGSDGQEPPNSSPNWSGASLNSRPTPPSQSLLRQTTSTT